MATLVRKRHAPRGAVVPLPIPREGLFNLDVDDPIWADVGLDDDDVNPDGTSASTPRWLSDNKVRVGIRGMLQLDRCLEEGERLIEERAVLEEWAGTEWKAIMLARDHARQ